MKSQAKAYDDPGSPQEQTRRKFLTHATIVLGNVIGLTIAVPAIAGLIPSSALLNSGKSWSTLKGRGWRSLSAKSPPVQIYFNRTVHDGYVPPSEESDYVWGVRMNAHEVAKMHADRPDLFQDPGGKVSYPVVTIGFALFSPICPHLGCKYSWRAALGRFLCPCHGSQYARDGEHLAGPAARGLDPMPLRERNGEAQVMWIRYKAATPDRIIVGYS